MSKGRRQLDLVIIHTRMRITGRFKGYFLSVYGERYQPQDESCYIAPL